MNVMTSAVVLSVLLLTACAGSGERDEQDAPAMAARSSDAEQARQTALTARQLEQPEMLASALAEWRELAPDDEQAWSVTIQHALDMADDKLLAEALMAWLELRRNSVDRWEDLAVSVRDYWHDDLLRETLAQVLAVVPDRASVLDNLFRSELAEAMGVFPQALRSAQVALEYIGEDDATLAQQVRAYRWHARLMNDDNQVLAELESLGRALELDPTAAEVRMQLAQRLAEQGFVDRALAMLREADDNDSRVLLMLGLLAAGQGENAVLDEAIGRLRDADNADDDKYRLHLAQLLALRGDREQAVDLLTSLSDGELGEEADYERARLLIQLDRVQQAEVVLKRLHQADDETLAARAWLLSAQLAGRQGGDQAFGVLSRGLAAVPDHPELLYARSLEAERLGYIDTAERDLRRIIAMDAEHAHAHNALGYMLTNHSERYDEAERLIERALELEPDDPAIIDSMGWLRFQQGDFDAAVGYLRKAHAMGFNAEIAAHLVQALAASGASDEASSLLQESLRQAPDSEPLLELKEDTQ